MSTLRDQRIDLEMMYEKSAFGAARVQIQLGQAFSRCRRRPALDESRVDTGLITDIVSMRSRQFLLSRLVRPGKLLCAPHVGHELSGVDAPELPVTGRKWTAWQKARASLVQTLLYVASTCRARFRGAVFALSVQEGTHSNVVYVDLPRGESAKCFLFEPNGTSFVARTGGLSRLRHAVARANDLAPGTFETEVTLADIDGVQVALGTDASDPSAYEGIGVCAAVTHWAIHAWANANIDRERFDAFVQALERRVRADPARYRVILGTFLQKTTEGLTAPLGKGSVYNAVLQAALERDFVSSDAKQHLGPFCQSAACETSRIDLEYKCSLGSVRAAGALALDPCQDLVDLSSVAKDVLLR